MINLAWGGFANGSAALKAACVQAVGGIPGDLLEPTTAAAWAGWRAAIAARTGVWLQLDHSDIIAPGFRDIPNQQAAWNRYQSVGRPVAAVVGTSNHGWGRALDVTGYENSAAVWQAMNDLAPQFGLSNATGVASGERWHWECINTPTTIAATAVKTITNTENEEDEMAAGVLLRETNGTVWHAPDDGDLIQMDNPDEYNALIACGAVRPVKAADGTVSSWWIQLPDGMILNKRKAIASRKHAQFASGK